MVAEVVDSGRDVARPVALAQDFIFVAVECACLALCSGNAFGNGAYYPYNPQRGFHGDHKPLAEQMLDDAAEFALGVCFAVGEQIRLAAHAGFQRVKHRRRKIVT